MTDKLTPGQISYSPDYKTAAREVVDGIFGLGPPPPPPPPLVKPAQSDPRDAEIARLSRDYNELRETHDRKADEIARLRAENENFRKGWAAECEEHARTRAILTRVRSFIVDTIPEFDDD